jgi:hypothetical protein
MAAFPPSIQRATSAMAERWQRRRAIRGIAFVVLILLCTAAIAVLADFAWDLPKPIRWVAFLGWLTVVGFAIRRFVVRPRQDPIDEIAFAGPIEAQYPHFAERLLTLGSVAAGTGSGSPHLVAHLKKECEKRAHAVDPIQTIPMGRSVRLAALATITALVAIAALLIVPGGSMRARRFVMPWSDGRPPSPFRIVVTSGEPLLKRGSTFPITASLERIRPGGEWPGTLRAMIREGQGNVTAITLVGDGRGAYAGVRPRVQNDFQYAVTLNAGEEAWLNVRVADAVSLTDGTKTTIDPPTYAQARMPRSERPGFDGADAVAHSGIRWTWTFDHPAESASLEMLTDSGRREAIPLRIDSSRRTATAETILLESGTYALSIVGDRGLRSTVVMPVRVVADQPPRFERVTGLADYALEIKPGERLPISASVSDDFAVTSLDLEYRVGDSEGLTRSAAIPGVGLNSRFADGRLVFDTTGLCPTGQTLRVRLRATDNRSVPAANLAPQSVTFPTDGWLSLRVTASARPLAEQQIFGQRDRIAESLRAALEEMNRVRQTVATLAGAMAYQLSDDQQVKLAEAREQMANAAEQLRTAKTAASLIPELKPVGEEAEAIALGPAEAARESMRKAGTDPESASRRAALRQSHHSTVEAAERTEKLLALNESLASKRLERRLMNDLAVEQRSLAERLANARSDQDRAAVKAEQQALAERLAATVREHPGLRDAADAHARSTATERARELANLLAKAADLDRRRLEAEATALATRNAEFAEKQKSLVDKVASATGSSAEATRLAQGANERFSKGDGLGAMADQEAAARALDQFAEGLDRAAAARKDPKEAAMQIAAWQTDFAGRLRQITKTISFDQLPEQARGTIRREATAIREAVASIVAPSALARKKNEAEKTAATALERLGSRSQDSDVSLAARATRDLAEAMPNRGDRLKAARIELNRINDAINEIAKALDEAKGPGETVKPLASRQADVSRRIQSLDAPGFEDRKERSVSVSEQLKSDLQNGRKADATTGLAHLRRQLDRFRQALNGDEPVDDAIDRLARQQESLARKVESLGPKPGPAELDAIGKLQREIGRELASHSPGDSPMLTRNARDAVENAERAHRDPAKRDVDELKKKTKSAAEAINSWADRVKDAEKETDRLERLTRNREEAARRASPSGPISLDDAATAKRNAQADLDELNQTRADGNDDLKSKAVAALRRVQQSPDPHRQPDLQKQAAEALAAFRDARRQSGDSAVRPRETPKPDFDTKTAPGLPTADRAQSARDLARQQRTLRDQASAAASAGVGRAGEGLKAEERALAGQATAWAQSLSNDVKPAGLSGSPGGQAMSESIAQAAESAGRAAMQAERAVREAAGGRTDSATEARQQRDREWRKTAGDLAGIIPAKADRPEGPNPGGAAASMALAASAIEQKQSEQARSQMTAAVNQLLGQPHGPPDGQGPPPDQSVPAATIPLPVDLKRYEGAPWGELPGDVRNRIVQEYAAKYGEDYARAMKLYFEQLADSK